jgi:hypothetical protein
MLFVDNNGGDPVVVNVCGNNNCCGHGYLDESKIHSYLNPLAVDVGTNFDGTNNQPTIERDTMPYDFDFESVQTYSDDYELFNKLGLKRFDGKCRQKIDVGTIFSSDKTRSVKIIVTGAPAQFWTLILSDYDKKTAFKISTGSGCLTDYWQVAQSFLDDMIGIDVSE